MKKCLPFLLVIACFLCVFPLFGQVPQLEWASSLQCPGSGNKLGVRTDLAGNFYISGVFAGTIDIDPLAGTHLLSTSDSTISGFFPGKI